MGRSNHRPVGRLAVGRSVGRPIDQPHEPLDKSPDRSVGCWGRLRGLPCQVCCAERPVDNRHADFRAGRTPRLCSKTPARSVEGRGACLRVLRPSERAAGQAPGTMFTLRRPFGLTTMRTRSPQHHHLHQLHEIPKTGKWCLTIHLRLVASGQISAKMQRWSNGDTANVHGALQGKLRGPARAKPQV